MLTFGKACPGPLRGGGEGLAGGVRSQSKGDRMADYTTFLRSLEIFQQLPDEELGRIGTRLKDRRFKEGQAIFRQGDPGDAMYLVFDGRVKIVSNDAQGHERVLAFTEEGGFFGEMALLTGE